jgi:hypothetical protein
LRYGMVMAKLLNDGETWRGTNSDHRDLQRRGARVLWYVSSIPLNGEGAGQAAPSTSARSRDGFDLARRPRERPYTPGSQTATRQPHADSGWVGAFRQLCCPHHSRNVPAPCGSPGRRGIRTRPRRPNSKRLPTGKTGSTPSRLIDAPGAHPSAHQIRLTTKRRLFLGLLMELSGFEPLTSWVRSRRSPN